jgi:hypothetical protein
MKSKYEWLSILMLALTFVLSSCSSMSTKSADTLSSKINLSEQIILASLSKKLNSGDVLEADAVDIQASCLLKAENSDSMDLSYDNFKVKLKEGASTSIPLTEEQMKEAFNLLKTGQVKSDVKRTLIQLLKELHSAPDQVLSDLPNIFRNPLDFPDQPGINTAGNTAKIFISPDNRTFRLAILAYARINGVNIEEENIDDLYRYLDSGHESDFNKLVEGGLNVMKDQYGLTDIEQVAQKFHSAGQACVSETA